MITPTNDYELAVFQTQRQFDSRLNLTLNGVTTLYDDNTIISIDIVEELSVLNDTLPSNELKVVLDNTNGQFDFFNYSNMQNLLSNKPILKPDFGLVIEGWNFWEAGGQPIDYSPLPSGYGNFVPIDSGDYTLTFTAYSPTGQTMRVTDTTTDGKSDFNQNFILNTTPTDYSFTFTSTNPDQNYHLVNVTSTTTASVASDIVVTDVKLVALSEESWKRDWVPMGKFYLSEWKNDADALTVTLVAHDNLLAMENIVYDNGLTTGTIYDLAVDVLNKSGLTSSDYVVDTSLQSYTNVGFDKAYSIRQALQLIGLATKSAVYQDRYGLVQIKPFEALNKTSPVYVYYSGSPWGEAMGWNEAHTEFSAPSPEISTNRMRIIKLDDMYNIPEISLDKTIYQLSIKVYGTVNASTIYTNPNISGTNGVSFSIDNPLITTTAQADAIATWYFEETLYNAVYKNNWRQNPVLECADLVTIEDGSDKTRQTRIYKNEYNYEGYLSGKFEARGGI